MIKPSERSAQMWSPEANAIMRRIIPAADADILIYHAPIERPRDRRLIEKVSSRRCRPNLLMILATNGGDPDAAYRIARCLQDHYKKFTVIVSGICKSSGTLLLLGANELAFSQNGELGPLDIQLAKKDELWESESGLTVMTALTALSENAQDAFDHFLVSLTTRSGGRITVRTASEIAAKLTQALYAPIADQIDPIHMGEVKRSMAIAKEYGARLIEKSDICEVESLNSLISGYASHGFVIDRAEAKKVFKADKVRDCTPDEMALIEDLGNYALIQLTASPWVRFISDDILEEEAIDATANAVLERPATAGPPPQADGNVPTNGQGTVPSTN
jgi:Serine dehydrogenase proteinase